MTNATTPKYRPESRYVETIDGAHVPVTMSGPHGGRALVMFDDPSTNSSSYGLVLDRLHVAMLRTTVISAHDGWTPKSVVAALDRLNVQGGLLVGDRAGGELAWRVAAAYGERFTGLVVIDSGHPGVPDVSDSIRDIHCPAVELDTTAMVTSRAARIAATASRRMVHGEFRLVEAAGPRNSRHFTTQLATEIVVRAISR